MNKVTKKIEALFQGVGRRKNSIATVKMVKGDGENIVNGMKLEEYFTQAEYKARIMSPFIATNTLGKYHFKATVSGGGKSGQVDSVKLGIARSLANLDENMHVLLSKESLLTRDPRAKERKKVFFVRARKKPQYSKR